jgi:hypothetical protein
LIVDACAPAPVAFEIPRLPSWSTARRERPFKQRDVVRALRVLQFLSVRHFNYFIHLAAHP